MNYDCPHNKHSYMNIKAMFNCPHNKHSYMNMFKAMIVHIISTLI